MNLMTAREAATRLRISRRTLARLVKQGLLKPVDIGVRKWLFREDDIQAFVARA